MPLDEDESLRIYRDTKKEYERVGFHNSEVFLVRGIFMAFFVFF